MLGFLKRVFGDAEERPGRSESAGIMASEDLDRIEQELARLGHGPDTSRLLNRAGDLYLVKGDRQGASADQGHTAGASWRHRRKRAAFLDRVRPTGAPALEEPPAGNGQIHTRRPACGRFRPLREDSSRDENGRASPPGSRAESPLCLAPARVAGTLCHCTQRPRGHKRSRRANEKVTRRDAQVWCRGGLLTAGADPGWTACESKRRSPSVVSLIRRSAAPAALVLSLYGPTTPWRMWRRMSGRPCVYQSESGARAQDSQLALGRCSGRRSYSGVQFGTT